MHPFAVAAWRQAFGAVALLVCLRPRLRGRSRQEWGAVAALGAGIAAMNAAFYQAVELLPLGIAATLLYLGPFAVAVSRTQVGPRLLLPVSALVGVGLVSRPSGDAPPTGILVGSPPQARSRPTRCSLNSWAAAEVSIGSR